MTGTTPSSLIAKSLVVVAAATFVVGIVASLALPTPELPWFDAVIRATLDRLHSGGPIYSDVHHSLVPAETPYFPANIFIAWVLDPIFPGLLGPRIIAVIITVSFFLLSWMVAFSLVESFTIAGAFVLIAFSILLDGWDRFQATSFFPDFLLASLSLVACLLVAGNRLDSRRWIRFTVLFGLFLAIGLTKQSSIAIFAGLGAYMVCFARHDDRKRLRLDFCALIAAGVSVCMIVSLLPNCFQATVLTMMRHPIFPRRLRYDNIPFLLVDRFWLLLPAAFAATSVEILRRPLARVLLCIALPYLAFQTLTSLKAGAGLYDYNVPMLLLAPIAAAGVLLMVRSKAQLMALAGFALLIGISINLTHARRDAASAKGKWSQFQAGSDWLTQFKGSAVLFDAYSYHVVRSAGLEPRTDICTLAHYGLAGIRSDSVVKAISERAYGVIVTNPDTDYYTELGSYYDSPAIRDYAAAMERNYRALPDNELPVYLRGRIMVPRKE